MPDDLPAPLLLRLLLALIGVLAVLGLAVVGLLKLIGVLK